MAEKKKSNTGKAVQQRLRKNDRVIVIGASTGGPQAFTKLVSSLPSDFYTPIIIVWHMPADVTGILPNLLNSCGRMYAANGINNEPIMRNRIYIAPPDHHILVEDERIRITKGPKENRFRPAVDPLFRSAAFCFGNRAIGVILTGGLDDGTSGLWAIKEFGGTAVIQHPAEAEASSMPEHAMNAVSDAYITGIDMMGDLLHKLSTAQPEKKKEMTIDKKLMKDEISIALQEEALPGTTTFGEATQYACPECHGVLAAIKENGQVRFRCHTGHAYSADTLLHDIFQKTEESLWGALRGFGEAVFLLNGEGDKLAALNRPKEAAIFFKKAIEAQDNAITVSDILKTISVNSA